MSKRLRILVIEDSEDDTELLLRELQRGGYEPVHERVDTADALRQALTRHEWDLVVSDYSIPGFSSLDALALVKDHESDIPFIIVSGTIAEDTAVAAMKAGAHDYLMKHNLKRLIAAVDRELREAEDRRRRKRAEAALRESQERFQELAENIREVFWLTTPDKGQMLYVSPAYEQIWGRTCESLYQAPTRWLEAIYPEDEQRVIHAISKQITGGYAEEYRIVRPDGSIRWIWDRAFPIRDQSGNVYRIAGVAEDITERKLLEDQFRQAQKMEAVGRLAGGITHDFNNLLTVIMGYCQLLLGTLTPDDPTRKEVEEIRKAGDRAVSLTRQLLAFSRRQVFQPLVLDLNKHIEGVESLVRRLIGEDITLVISKAPDLGKVLVDPGQIPQIIMNLAVNARDAMPEGGQLTIETANVDFSDASIACRIDIPPGHFVMLAVSDTGIGMDAETKTRLFEPFFTTKEPGKGTGLGLSTVYGIVKQSGGAIRVYSERGFGTTIKIYLPRIQYGTDLAAVPTPARIPETRGIETVLLVEDEESLRRLTRKILERNGYTVLVAQDGAEALQICEAHQGSIHLLLTDIVLPGMNGRELVQRVLRILPQIRVVYMSGYTDRVIGQLGIPDLDGPFLEKPFTSEALTRKLREALAGAGGRAIHGPGIHL